MTSLMRVMVDMNVGPSRVETARLSVIRRSGEVDEDEVDGIEDNVESESDDSDVKDDEFDD